MSRIIPCAILALSIFGRTTVRADPYTDLSAAIANLCNAPSYTWTASTSSKLTTTPGGGRIDGTHEDSYTEGGQFEKDGYATYTLHSVGDPTEVYLKGNKLVIRSNSGYHTTQQSSPPENVGSSSKKRVVTARDAMPDVQLKGLANKLESIAFVDGVYSADLETEAAKALTSPPSGKANDIKEIKFTFKFWITDGVLTKYENHCICTFANGSHLITEENTKTTLIKDIGSTKIDLPAQVKASLDN